jgi:hypothetical protein
MTTSSSTNVKARVNDLMFHLGLWVRFARTDQRAIELSKAAKHREKTCDAEERKDSLEKRRANSRTDAPSPLDADPD